MEPWTDAEVREALGLQNLPARDGLRFSGIGTDTRTLREGELFVALRGPHHDAHHYLAEAAAKGAGAAVVHRTAPSEALLPLYPVSDTLVALGALAAYRRRALRARVVGVTGSSGKTTVKELLRGILGSTLRTHVSSGNLNNRVGLPLTLLQAPADAEVVVVEMGTSEPGEIGILTAIAAPDAGLVTTVTEAHLERLGSVEGVLIEKLSLLEGVDATGPVVVGDEPPELAREARARRPDVVVTGLSARADEAWRAELLDVDDRGRWSVRLPRGQFRSGLPGRHGVRNALLALAMADRLGVPHAEAVRWIEAATPPALRGEVRSIADLTLLLDCYNANPQSTRAALEMLRDSHAPGPRIAVLGSMLELGAGAAALHRAVLDEALESGFEIVVAVGLFRDAAEAASREGDERAEGPLVLIAGDADEAFERLRPHLRGDETLLLKGSRGVALERMIPRLEAAFAGTPGGGD